MKHNKQAGFTLIEVMVVVVILGILAAFMFFYYPYVSDSIDIDELNTENRREGMHFGINALVTKPAEQLAAIIGATILLLTGYIQGGNAADQPAAAINGLKFMGAVLPIIFTVIVIISQLINPCKGEFLKEMKEKIIQLHEEKKKKYKVEE